MGSLNKVLETIQEGEETKRNDGEEDVGWGLAAILFLSVFVWDRITGGGFKGGILLIFAGILFLLFFSFLFLGVGLLKLKPLARIISAIYIFYIVTCLGGNRTCSIS